MRRWARAKAGEGSLVLISGLWIMRIAVFPVIVVRGRIGAGRKGRPLKDGSKLPRPILIR